MLQRLEVISQSVSHQSISQLVYLSRDSDKNEQQIRTRTLH